MGHDEFQVIVATPCTLVETAASIQRSRDFSGFLVIENVMSYERDRLEALGSPQQGESRCYFDCLVPS